MPSYVEGHWIVKKDAWNDFMQVLEEVMLDNFAHDRVIWTSSTVGRYSANHLD